MIELHKIKDEHIHILIYHYHSPKMSEEREVVGKKRTIVSRNKTATVSHSADGTQDVNFDAPGHAATVSTHCLVSSDVPAAKKARGSYDGTVSKSSEQVTEEQRRALTELTSALKAYDDARTRVKEMLVNLPASCTTRGVAFKFIVEKSKQMIQDGFEIQDLQLSNVLKVQAESAAMKETLDAMHASMEPMLQKAKENKENVFIASEVAFQTARCSEHVSKMNVVDAMLERFPDSTEVNKCKEVMLELHTRVDEVMDTKIRNCFCKVFV